MPAAVQSEALHQSALPISAPSGEMEDPLQALEAARKQIAALQARLRAVLANNATLEQHIADGQQELGRSRSAQQGLLQSVAQLEAQLATQQGWQVRYFSLNPEGGTMLGAGVCYTFSPVTAP